MDIILAIIKEEAQRLFEQRIYGIPELADILKRKNWGEYMVDWVRSMLTRAFRHSGDQGVIDTFAQIAGVQIEAVGKGRYMFANLVDPEKLDIPVPQQEQVNHMKIREAMQDENKNRGVLKRSGKEFWIGAVSVLDGYIEEIHTYEEAEKYDFHHSFYFSQNAQEKIEDEEWMVFWVDKYGINGEWTHGSIPQDIINKISQQILIK